ncbi:T9SS type A sorting domain-containing protein [Natronoflexus pectinivorans]|uniref:Putative secreted protein (Por secretion system target) n=1 Tax=Natronoflexus pectinivorans TaxID=682526 RepID=A0A4R2GIK3_9BACT|nr:T9SS type A sorting domain-containing protein [Natronoflexus pectinivorans]TCO07124.1 putative secreted protein (Por secretion system target) [Natronoflexus pectinivorans]
MKKIYLFLTGILAFTFFCNAQYVTLYTPNGSPVQTLIRSEGSTEWITITTNQYKVAYGEENVLAPASQRYNCHNYAWHMSEGNTEIVWMNQYDSYGNSNVWKYWTDGSYVETTENNGEKIFYYNGDHSAIKSKTVAGKYESKWGSAPLMRHYPTQGPSIYEMSYRRYYKLAYAISGPTTICDEAPYSINNLPSVDAINWTTSNSLTVISGQNTPQVTVSSTGEFSTSHFVKATISMCGSSFEIRKNISRVGNENAAILLYDIDGMNSYHSGTILTNYLVKAHLNNPSPDPGHYRWTIIAPPKSGIPNRLASGQTFPFSTDYSGGYTFRLSYFAECGWSTVTKNIYFGFAPLVQVKIYPNPATGETSVSLELSSGEDLNSMSSQIWEFEVHDQNQRLITHQRNINSNSHTINTAGWQKGLYIVTVTYNGEVFSEKLVVK